ncbi:MAG: 16S rRNA (cytidine(1402)-2'-O)-methyltransferase [Candidatus Roizmanbacteria bacterium]
MFYIIGTPIGNMDDLSLRAAHTLASVDIILTEDTRSFDVLWRRVVTMCEMSRLEIVNKPMIISYYKEVEFEKLPDIIDWLNNGKNIALVSEAGMPVISDPGQLLVSTVKKRDIPYTVIPGPSALDTALVISGMKHDHCMFLGFLSRKENDIRKILEKIHAVHQSIKDTIFIAYDSPERISATTQIVKNLYPTAEVIIARELTKKFEQIINASAPGVDLSQIRGECVLLIRFTD